MKVLVIGSGVAGLVAALEASEAGHDVTLLSKSDLATSNTRFAQGGVAVVLGDDDTVAEHVEDTLVAGAGLSDPDTVGILCFEGPDAMRELIGRGVQFDMHGDELAHGLEAAHTHARILHAGGDATGAGIAYALIEDLRQSRVDIRERTTAVDLIVRDGRAVGVVLLGGEEIRADAVVLATGGAGQLFPYTTNPEVATADGVAMALRAGAVAADLEFYQFHPTSLAAPGNFLVSEAVRGEGAVLLDIDGNRFTEELAPRDQVARAIADQMAKQGGTPVRLDATKLGGEFLAQRFPNIDAACRAQGFDWGTDADPGHAGRALLHGRCPNRRVGTHVRAGSLCRRRGGVQRTARREPAGVQLAAGRRRLRPTGRRGIRDGGCPGSVRATRGPTRSPSISAGATPRKSPSPGPTSSSSCGMPPACPATLTDLTEARSGAGHLAGARGHRRQVS